MMEFMEVNGRRYAQFASLRTLPGLVHAFGTRPMNVSPESGPIGFEQRALMVADWGFEPDHLWYCKQVHRTALAVIEHATPGGVLGHCDGVITALRDVALMTFSADCPLVLVHDPARGVLGLAHASWRCTVAQIVTRLIDLMVSRFECAPERLVAGIGPGAGPCCYEVGDDVYRAAGELPQRDEFFSEHNGRLHFDLWQANAAQLRAAGLSAENVTVAGVCTLCRNDVFFSYRREGAGCGHFGLLAGLRGS